MACFACGLSVTYFANYTFSGISNNFLAISLAIQWATVYQMMAEFHLSRIEIDLKWLVNLFIAIISNDSKTLPSLLKAEWSAIATGISLIAVHGKISAIQIILLSMLEPVFFQLNEILLKHLNVTDMTGGLRVCTFGSLFGFGLSVMLWRYNSESRQKRLHTSAPNQLYVLISVIWLYCLWPSFVSSLSEGDKRHRIVVNCYLSMVSATVTSFALASMADPKDRFSIVSSQRFFGLMSY